MKPCWEWARRRTSTRTLPKEWATKKISLTSSITSAKPSTLPITGIKVSTNRMAKWMSNTISKMPSKRIWIRIRVIWMRIWVIWIRIRVIWIRIWVIWKSKNRNQTNKILIKSLIPISMTHISPKIHNLTSKNLSKRTIMQAQPHSNHNKIVLWMKNKNAYWMSNNKPCGTNYKTKPSPKNYLKIISSKTALKILSKTPPFQIFCPNPKPIKLQKPNKICSKYNQPNH